MSRAAAHQFPKVDFRIVKLPKVKSREQIDEIVGDVKEEDCVVFYTLAETALRAYLEEKARQFGIARVDILGPAIHALEIIAETPPDLKPGIGRQLNRNYFRRIEALEFAVKHDDGKDARGLKEAEIVLIGVSRTSKTPLSMYLAYRGWKVANIPIVYGIDLPAELFQIESERIIGLRLDPKTLLDIRGKRISKLMNGNGADYARLDGIMKELDFAAQQFKRLGCRVVDVGNKAIEETTNEIIKFFTSE